MTNSLPKPANGIKFTDPELELLWQELGEIPVNNHDELEEDFYHWEAGTDKFTVWHFFDLHYSTGVYQLMFPYDQTTA